LSNGFLSQDPNGAATVVLALRDACRWIERNRNERAAVLAPHLSDMEEADIQKMLAHQPAPVHLLGHWLRDQMAQYADELKLLEQLPDSLNSGAFAQSICQNVLHV
jgi:NitT/TauT family transport system substrate-binding protein